MNFSAAMKISMPFLTNNKDLQVGDLLVLPFDGGCEEVFSVPPSQSAASSGYEPIDEPWERHPLDESPCIWRASVLGI